MRTKSFSTRITGSMTPRIFRRAIEFWPCRTNLANRGRIGRIDRKALFAMRKIGIAAFSMLALCAPLAAQDPLAAALAQYQHETDPVRKARELVKFGGEQIELAKKQLKSGDEVGSLHTLEQYRDEVRETIVALKATGVDAEKKPAGFKELQISLRETIRHIDDLIFTLPVDKRPFFREVRADLVVAQNDLIDELFPRKPDQKSRKPNP